MLQSLPFGGVKDSGFGRFAGIEGLRACCLVKSVVEDRFWPLIKTKIPKPIQASSFLNYKKNCISNLDNITVNNNPVCGQITVPGSRKRI